MTKSVYVRLRRFSMYICAILSASLVVRCLDSVLSRIVATLKIPRLLLASVAEQDLPSITTPTGVFRVM